MAGRLEKLRIHNEDTGESFHVLFNPTQYSIEEASKWQDQDRMGQQPELHYTGGERKKLTLDLFFDTYESRTDVRRYTSQVSGLLLFNREAHRPPKITISWGSPPPGTHTDFPLTCVLQSLKQHFVLFLGDGTPVRATLACVFVEFTLPAEELQQNEPHSPDHTKSYVVKEGDTLSGIAGIFYRDPRLWRPIAERNEIDNPRLLPAGAVLTIPRIA
jgi:nucleoid-associated protein YgaU